MKNRPPGARSPRFPGLRIFEEIIPCDILTHGKLNGVYSEFCILYGQRVLVQQTFVRARIQNGIYACTCKYILRMAVQNVLWGSQTRYKMFRGDRRKHDGYKYSHYFCNSCYTYLQQVELQLMSRGCGLTMGNDVTLQTLQPPNIITNFSYLQAPRISINVALLLGCQCSGMAASCDIFIIPSFHTRMNYRQDWCSGGIFNVSWQGL